jgi:DNA-binding Xre family transcriptional regulator
MAIRLCIKSIAEEKGISMSQLARDADMGMTSMRRMWHGTASGNIGDPPLENVNLVLLEKIAVALNVTPHDLLVYTPEPIRRHARKR